MTKSGFEGRIWMTADESLSSALKEKTQIIWNLCSRFKYWIIILAVLLGAAFYSETSKRNPYPYIPEDYYLAKIECAGAPDEVKFAINPQWMYFVNSWNISKTDEKTIENWVFRLTFGDVFSEESPTKAWNAKKRTIEVLVGEHTILIDGIYYSHPCNPNNQPLIDALVARWDQAPSVG